MNKQLSPLESLEALERIRSHNYHELPKRECLRIIETALKDYDRRLKLAKEYKDVNNVAKRLKALEVIKKYNDVISLHKEFNEEDGYTEEEIKANGGQKYYIADGSDQYRKHEITKEEYDLLKEVLL